MTRPKSPPARSMPKTAPKEEPKFALRQADPEARKARCFDPDWEYTPANSTDLAAKFKRLKREMKEAQAAKPHIVATIKKVA